MPAHPDLAHFLSEARQILEEAYGPLTEAVHITIRSGGREISYGWPSERIGATLVALSPREREILGVVGAATLTAKAIAARLHCQPNAALRAILANLCEREPPVLESGRAGYRKAQQASS
jgi:hypothetical protein